MHLLLPLLCLLLAAALATGSYFLWARFTRKQVARAVADFERNGSADDLRKGYHQRESWRRLWPWLGLTTMVSLPMVFVKPWYAGAMVWLAMGLLLLGYFARYFTPLLNKARDLPYWQASSDSASWPDAAAWRITRATDLSMGPSPQVWANDMLSVVVRRAWLLCRLGAGVLALGAVAVAMYAR